jgi:hypothetical protein
VPQKGSKGIVSCSYTKDHPYKLKDPVSDIRIYLRREVYQDPVTKEQTLIYITDRIDTKHKRHGVSYDVGQDETAAAAPC